MSTLVLILIAFVPPLLWAITHYLDNFLLNESDDEDYSPGALLIFSALFSLTILIILTAFNWEAALYLWESNRFDVYILILSGFLYVVWVGIYLFALKNETPLKVIPYLQFVPIFIFLTDFFIYGDLPKIIEIISAIIFVIGGMLLAFDVRKMKFNLGIASMMILVALILAIDGSLFDHATHASGGKYFVALTWHYLGAFITGVLIFLSVPSFRRKFFEMFKKKESLIKVITVNSLNELLESGAHLFLFFGLVLGQNTVISSISNASEPMLLFIVGLILTIFFPHFGKEDINKHNIKNVIASVVCLTVGIIILFTG